MWEDVKRTANEHGWGAVDIRDLDRLLADAEALLEFKNECERVLETGLDFIHIVLCCHMAWKKLPDYLREQGEG